MSEAAHPRDVFDYARGDAVEQAFLDALERGRLHHAWLLTGPEGVGKATFAYRAARRLLGGRPDPALGHLGVAADDPEARLISARAHPDLLTLERAVEDGKVKKNISVDETRALPEFFTQTPSRAAYRVAIIDAVDDMNINASNALLKILEEPPERGILFLISHSPGRLLATIRSRCRRLAFAPWTDDEVAMFLRARLDVTEEALGELVGMAGGAPGRAMRLASTDAIAFDALARELASGRAPKASVMVKLADSFRGADGQVRFELLFERLAAAVRARASIGGPDAEGWADLWDKLIAAPIQADALNLDRADVLFSHLAELEALARPC